MAAAAAAADQATDLLQKLALDTTADAGDVLATKEKVPAKGAVAAVGNLQPGVEALQDYNDASMYYGAYPAYAYGAYGAWGDYSTYLSHDGAQTPTSGAYADMYYGYAPYGVATLGHDGQIYGSQNYQYPSTYNKQQNSTAKLSSNVKSEKLAPSPQGDVSSNGIDGVKSLKNSNSSLKSERPVSNGSYGRSSGRSSYQNQNNWSAYPYYSSEMFSDKQQKFNSNRNSTASNVKTKGQSRNQNTRQYPHLMTPTSPMGSPSVYSANGIYGYDGSSYGSGLCEDDVHKSIKYNVWASTPNGNKKLDAAYQDAKEKSSESPVFLLFSVNASGQFVGLAEMVGRVDFNKTVEHWQQDKWTGCFPVKWHIVKDVPNSLLKHIILENNENKPVTNSRDTHEVRLEKGLQVLKIFKDHVCKTSILDDFGFYDNREKMMQERKAKQQQSLKKVIDVQVANTDDAEKKSLNGETGLPELTKVEVDVLNKESSLDKTEEKNDVKENGVAPEVLKSATEKLAGTDGC
nr:unnamed protein product [Digitaria exilis]